MKKFRVRDYEIKSDKLCPGASVRLALLADLHGLEFGRENKRLFSALEQRRPDAVLLAGDMVVRKDPEGLPGIARFIGRLAARFPVYYALGNHECRMLLNPEQSSAYLKYEETLKKRGVHILHNENSGMEIQNFRFRFYGLEIPMEYYAKPRSPRLTAEKVRELVGFPDPDSVCVLLAHNPKYGKAYFSWGADVIVCGHYHGGIIRLNEHHGLSCPQYLFLPPYCCGDFHEKGGHMFVSPGVGEHTIPVRIHNPREVLMITVKN